MSRLLIDEYPLLVSPTLAKEIGLNEAIVLQQLHYWTVQKARQDDFDGWVWNTVEEWRDQFPFWSPATIKRTFGALKTKKLVEVRQRNGTDRTNHYRLIYANVPGLHEVNVIPSNGSDDDDATAQDRPDGRAQADLLSTTPETSAETSPETDPVREIVEHFSMVFGKGKVNGKIGSARRSKIKARLEEVASPEDLKVAICGAALDPWINGTHPDSPGYSLATILRDEDQVVRFTELAEAKLTSEKDDRRPDYDAVIER